MQKHIYVIFTTVLISIQNLCAVDYSVKPSPENLKMRDFGVNWISPDAVSSQTGVFHFRKTFDLEEKPQSFVVHVSADNRYRLFVNGKPVGFGPARGAPIWWYYETYDIAPLLVKGKNAIAATVWNFGRASPYAQMSVHTSFLLFGDTQKEKFVNSDATWKFIKNDAWTWNIKPRTVLAGHTEILDATKHLWGWEDVNYDDSAWEKATVFKNACASSTPYGERDWRLVARDIPMMEETPQSFKSIPRDGGIADAKKILSDEAFEIPANTKCSILFDQGCMTTAYPELVLSGGKSASVKLHYAENLSNSKGKGNRNELEGKDIPENAPFDLFICDGENGRLFRPLWMRAWRFVRMDIETKDSALKIEKFTSQFTAYPFEEKALFNSDDESLKKIWEVGWRTARLCAHETYFDCPYYEQLQYIGDTRVQALISLYVAGDERLMRKAIIAFDMSREPMGLTQSRFPNWRSQFIPPFSLIWINMLADYQLFFDDLDFVKERYQAIHSILNWYESNLDKETGFLKANLPYWNFADWVTTWPRGIPPESDKSGSALQSLHFVYALLDAAQLAKKLGYTDDAKYFQSLADSVKKSVYEKCWDKERQLLRDCIGEGDDFFSQHTNIMGIITDTIPAENQKSVFEKITLNPFANSKKFHTPKDVGASKTGGISEATFYYKFYLVMAMKKVGLAEKYLDTLMPWHDMIANGLTTFSESPDPCRSECHAWSSSPNYYLLSTVCGIEPLGDGFKSVKISPHLGKLNFVSGKVPHKLGFIEVEFKKTANGALAGSISLPEGLDGVFIYGNKEIKLKSGLNKVEN